MKLEPVFMKYLKLLLFFNLVAPEISHAQLIELINSGEVIKRGVALYDSGLCKKALIEHSKVSRSDTNYVRALYEKAISLEADSQYAEAVKCCKEGLALKERRDIEPDFYNTYGNVVMDMGKYEEAIHIFDAAIARYPAYSLLYFNKGVALVALNRQQEAEQLFKKTLMITPYMYSAHYQLGLAALKQGKIIPAFLSFLGYLMVNPEGKYWSKSINYLSQITKSTDLVLEYKNKRTDAPDALYQEVEDIVLSKIALDKAYKPIIALDDPISRQIQAVFEKLEYQPADKDFWIQYYLPYYKQVFTGGKFELFINHIFLNAKVDEIQQYNKKYKKEQQAFVNEAGDYFNQIRSTRELFFSNRDTITKKYVYDEGKLAGRGLMLADGKTLVGPWEFNFGAGNLKGKGQYNPTGGREGERTFFYFSGKLQAREQYKNGKLDGGQDNYYENGNLSSHLNYANGLLDGLETTYYKAGAIKAVSYYKADKKNGEVRDFYSNGSLQSVGTYVKGLLTGLSRTYFKSGQLKEEEQYTAGKADGLFKSYHENGSTSVEGVFVKDIATGSWKYYHKNGKLKEIRNYVNDKEEGVHEEYYDNGALSAKYLTKKGKINGEADFFNKEGKMSTKYMYDNGVVKSIVYLNRDGAVTSTSELKNEMLDVTSNTIDGIKKEHFFYDKKGSLQGPDTEFYASGKVKEAYHYKDGDLDGSFITYYLNGNKKIEKSMTAGKNDGYYTEYYFNGQKESEGWIVNGQLQGDWAYYDELGKLTTKAYYLNGDLDGYKEVFNPAGKKVSEEKYYVGWLDRLTQYDTTGNVIAIDSFPKGSGKYTLVYPNGKLMTQGTYKNGDLDGPHKTFYFDGSVESSYFYNRGLLDSTYVLYRYGGIKESEGRYHQGNKTGTWKFYDADGKLSGTTQYADDEMNGEKYTFFPNGNKDLFSIYKDGELEGPEEKYDPDGTLSYRINFETNKAKNYTYLGKDGKALPPIPIAAVNGTMKAYYSNGKLSRLCHYDDGVKNGTDSIYYASGQLMSADKVAWGTAMDTYLEFYPDGKVNSEYHYLNGNANGVCKEFDKNGQIKREIVYVNGINHGPEKVYNDKGKLAQTRWYYYGKLLSVKNE